MVQKQPGIMLAEGRMGLARLQKLFTAALLVPGYGQHSTGSTTALQLRQKWASTAPRLWMRGCHSQHTTDYEMMLSSESSGGRGGRKETFVVMVFLLKVAASCACFPKSAWTSVCLWEAENSFFFKLYLSTRLLFSLLNNHYLKQWVFLPSFYFIFIPCERGMMKMLGWYLAVG